MRARRIFVRPQGATSVDINVTPLIDVVLVLLIIFMVVTPLSEKEIAVKLPEVSEEPAGATPEEQVVVGVTAEGRFTINAEPIGDEDYIPRLRRILAARPEGQKLLFFMPDGRARYSRLVAALNGAKAAGAETLGMIPQQPKTP
jgi:biopolymer transport protein ExbD